MHVKVFGKKADHSRVEQVWYIEAFDNDGPQIPTIPAIIMTEKILSQQVSHGMQPCVDLISLDEYLSALSPQNIQVSLI